MPQGEAVGDDLHAPFVRDRHIEVHVGEPDVASDPGTGLATDSRDGMLKGQRACARARGEDTRCKLRPPHGQKLAFHVETHNGELKEGPNYHSTKARHREPKRP